MAAVRRLRVVALSVLFVIITLYYLTNEQNTWNYGYSAYIPRPDSTTPKIYNDERVHWLKLPEKYPVASLIPLPSGRPKKIRPVQAAQPKEDAKQKADREQRLEKVKESFVHSWEGYKKKGWLRDEVAPVSGKWRDTFGGWAATLVDSLDTLWIMGLKDDFELAVKACESIDFSTTNAKEVNVFETTIRYMGGFLAAYDISHGKYPILLVKAVEVGELLMSVFDTPNRMPISRWDWQKYGEGEAQKAPQRMLVSELGSMSLEFTRLSQLTGELKYYDAVQRISDVLQNAQNSTKLPGMWPVSIDAEKPSFDEDTMFTLGGMSDSLYEYFPKQFLILGGLLEQPKILYERFIDVAKAHMFFRIYNPKNEALLVSGDIRMRNDEILLEPRGQHLTCFTGGMVGLASKIFDRPADLATAEELAAGCVWAYDQNANGIAPEIFSVMPCPKNYDCKWSDQAWHDAIKKAHSLERTVSVPDKEAAVVKIIADRKLQPGFTNYDDRRYILRPEAIESVFIMWRITGDIKWQNAAWRMFEAIEKVSRTNLAASAISDITVDPKKGKPEQTDSMESFWLAETLKYFYLCFADFDIVSLDDFVLNTEAHPLRRPGR